MHGGYVSHHPSLRVSLPQFVVVISEAKLYDGKKQVNWHVDLRIIFVKLGFITAARQTSVAMTLNLWLKSLPNSSVVFVAKFLEIRD